MNKQPMRSSSFERRHFLLLASSQRFLVHGQPAQGDCHLYASRTRFVPEKLLGLFERTAWPVVPAGSAARTAGQGQKLDIGARDRVRADFTDPKKQRRASRLQMTG
jgi:hypothetical protein